MKDKIKEIDITKDLYLCSPLLNTKCSKKSCYINNGSCCHTINNEYSQEHLLDYITNLQNRIKELEEINKQHQELNGMLNQRTNRLKEEIEQWKKNGN